MAILLAQTIGMLIQIITLLIFVRILLSWAPMAGIQIDPYNPIINFIMRTSDVFLEPFRRVIPPLAGMDLSPMIAVLVLQLVGDILVRVILSSSF
jgi:YggT family protein